MGGRGKHSTAIMSSFFLLHKRAPLLQGLESIQTIYILTKGLGNVGTKRILYLEDGSARLLRLVI